MQDLEDLLRGVAVRLEITGDENPLAAEPPRPSERHRGANSEYARFVRSGRHHSPLTRNPAPAHDDRLAAQLGPAQLLDRGVERIQVDVHDDARHVRIYYA